MQYRYRGKTKNDKSDEEIEDLSDGEFEEFINSEQGKKELQRELKMFQHVAKDRYFIALLSINAGFH